jgi:hypothetical protein
MPDTPRRAAPTLARYRPQRPAGVPQGLFDRAGADLAQLEALTSAHSLRAGGTMTIDDFLADPASRFATVAMTDTNGLAARPDGLGASLKGIARNGMGMSPVTLALDPTDVVLVMPGVSDDTSISTTIRSSSIPQPASLPWSKPGHDLLVLSNYSGGTSAKSARVRS